MCSYTLLLLYYVCEFCILLLRRLWIWADRRRVEVHLARHPRIGLRGHIRRCALFVISCLYTCIYCVCMYVCMYIYIYIYTHVYICNNKEIYIYICTYYTTRVCMCLFSLCFVCGILVLVFLYVLYTQTPQSNNREACGFNPSILVL